MEGSADDTLDWSVLPKYCGPDGVIKLEAGHDWYLVTEDSPNGQDTAPYTLSYHITFLALVSPLPASGGTTI